MKKDKRVIILSTAILLVVAYTAFLSLNAYWQTDGSEYSELLTSGQWVSEESGDIITFEADGKGSYREDDQEYVLYWSVSNDGCISTTIHTRDLIWTRTYDLIEVDGRQVLKADLMECFFLQ